MQKVISINLNGNAYQVEEQGYDALVAYLARAQSSLETNPDKAEILADLEQAIAEKCQRFFGPNKTVVASAEIDQILTEMGPVEASAAPSGGAGGQQGQAEGKTTSTGTPGTKRLYQIREGAMLTGVCNGLAAYLNLDVTLIRVAFVILALLTKGVWILVYAVLSFVIPYANTSEERAAARGRRFTAKDLIDEAKTNLNRKDWKRHLRQQRRQLRHQIRGMAWQYRWGDPNAPDHVAYTAQLWGGLTAPLFGLINFALLLVLALALVSVASTSQVFGYPLPPGVPIWLWFVLLVLIYQIVASPFKYARRAASCAYGPPPHITVFGPFLGLLWMFVLFMAVWWAYGHLPEVQQFIQNIPDIWDRLVEAR